MNEQIKKQAQEIGERGNFITLVPDLYRGKVAIDREEAGHLVSGLDWHGAVADIKGAAEFLMNKGCTNVSSHAAAWHTDINRYGFSLIYQDACMCSLCSQNMANAYRCMLYFQMTKIVIFDRYCSKFI